MTKSKTGGRFVQLIERDCIEWMRAQPAGSVDCVVTSPPYNPGVSYGKHDDSMSVRGYLELRWPRAAHGSQ